MKKRLLSVRSRCFSGHRLRALGRVESVSPTQAWRLEQAGREYVECGDAEKNRGRSHPWLALCLAVVNEAQGGGDPLDGREGKDDLDSAGYPWSAKQKQDDGRDAHRDEKEIAGAHEMRDQHEQRQDCRKK